MQCRIRLVLMGGNKLGVAFTSILENVLLYLVCNMLLQGNPAGLYVVAFIQRF